jgi:enamine deaminase RidA (YjgF/YER057c/UK114 family)
MQIKRLVNDLDPTSELMTWTPAWQIGQEVVLSGMTANPNAQPLGLQGQGGLDAGADMYSQTMAVFEKIESWLKVAGGHRHNLVKTVVYVTDISLKSEVGRARRDFFGGYFPLSTLVEVSGLVFPQLRVEIDAWARLDVDIRQAL